MLFIAPLLFNETRKQIPPSLEESRLDPFACNRFGYCHCTQRRLRPPSAGAQHPLAAAFAFAAALGPTDAATVTALRSSVHLSNRQRTLLSGESLINDASGVVAFHFPLPLP